MYSIKQKGMTLIELTVVLLILVALAGLTIPYVSGTSRKALCDATDVSMMNIKQVIMQRYYLDTLGNFPVSKSGSTIGSDYSLNYLFDQTDWADFDPDSQVGWRGPYLQGAQVLKSNVTAENFNDVDYLDYTKLKFDAGQYVVMDSWGRPIVLQVVNNADCISSTKWDISTAEPFCARIVSAGAGSGLKAEDVSLDTKIEGRKGGDDRVLYLNVPTHADDINTPCGE